jgi:hypothetical protein
MRSFMKCTLRQIHIIRMINSGRMTWTEDVTCMGEKRIGCRVWVGKPEGNIPLGRPRRRWEENIKMDFREIS